jgi:hypothetical protein
VIHPGLVIDIKSPNEERAVYGCSCNAYPGLDPDHISFILLGTAYSDKSELFMDQSVRDLHHGLFEYCNFHSCLGILDLSIFTFAFLLSDAHSQRLHRRVKMRLLLLICLFLLFGVIVEAGFIGPIIKIGKMIAKMAIKAAIKAIKDAIKKRQREELRAIRDAERRSKLTIQRERALDRLKRNADRPSMPKDANDEAVSDDLDDLDENIMEQLVLLQHAYYNVPPREYNIPRHRYHHSGPESDQSKIRLLGN